jgi:pimeloyl-ACP methyl ester carboxylesterase
LPGLDQEAIALTTSETSPEMLPWQALPEPAPMPRADHSGFAMLNGIRLYHAIFNASAGNPVLLLHGGMGNSDHWGNQVAMLMQRRRVIVVDSRGHGRSTSGGGEPLSYRLMAADIVGLLAHLAIDRVAIVGWSDGGIIGLEMAIAHRGRVSRLWAEGASSNPAALKEPHDVPILRAMAERAAADYARLSPTPEALAEFKREIRAMWSSEPDFQPEDLASIAAPTAIVAGEHDELVKRENTEEMARLIPGARLIILPGVSHFGLWQDPAGYNAALAGFLDRT